MKYLFESLVLLYSHTCGGQFDLSQKLLVVDTYVCLHESNLGLGSDQEPNFLVDL